jgi:ABC-type branched-subunit amino acid transport system ATPase component
MLNIDNIHVSIGKKKIINNVSMSIGEGEIIALIGHNGAGKSTMLESIIGARNVHSGTIHLNETLISDKATSEIVQNGVGLVPQLNNVFRNLSVEENLELGSVAVRGSNPTFTIESIYELFPILKERKKQLVGTMSGGQRQMVAIGIGLMSNPKFLLLDEPSVGLQPNLVDKIMEQITFINKQFGISILIVEQNINKVMSISDRVYVMSRGHIIKEFIPGAVKSEELWALL